MDPASMALIGSVAAPVVGGLVGNIMGSSDRKRQQAAMAAAYAQLEAVGVPPDLSKEIIMREFQSQGILTPELEQDIHLGESQAAQIKEDPSLRAAQMESLQTLGQVSRGGLQAGDRAAYNELRAATQRDAEAKRQQILQQMQAQGMGGGGAQLMAQLQAGQAAEDTSSAAGDRLAAQASQNALAALGQRAQLAGGVRTQDMSAEELRAKAIDDRNRFLYENSASRQRANIGALNQAQQANLANKQRLSEMNVQQSNVESQRQQQAKRDYWQDQMGLAQAKANALVGQAGAYGASAERKSGMASGIGSAIGQGMAAYGAYSAKAPTKTARPDDESDVYSYVPKFGERLT